MTEVETSRKPVKGGTVAIAVGGRLVGRGVLPWTDAGGRVGMLRTG